jgi:hypothetical protein
VKVCPSEDTEFPDYVFVRSICKLIKRNDCDCYGCFPTERSYPFTTLAYDDSAQHRPAEPALNAASAPRIYKMTDRKSVDFVCCIRCLVWPPQAEIWIARRRKHGWPESTTIECIVKSGCDAVQISHPQCRDDEWMIKRQWRL